MNNKRKENLTTSITLLSIVPLLLLGVLLALITSAVIYLSLKDEVKYSLGVLVHSSYNTLELTYPGAFEIRDSEVYKGGRLLKDDLFFVDNIKRMSGADITLFLDNKRYLTTIMTADGRRAIGTTCHEVVKKAVLEDKNDFFSSSVRVNEIQYFGYYMPLRNNKGEIIGMLFAGKPSNKVMQKINRNIIFVLLPLFLIMTITAGISYYFGREIIISLNKTKIFLGHIARGNLSAEIDPKVLKRKDEIGEMGRFAVMLQNSIADLVSKDPLTGLYNRRSGDMALENLEQQYKKKNVPFTVVMADIDNFKKINDTYGHQIGDEILKMLSCCMADCMQRLGFVFRWGGEEFLLLYENMEVDEACKKVEELQDLVTSKDIAVDGFNIPVTLTFGIASCLESESIEGLLSLADARLYQGKSLGKNCIV